MKCSVRSYIQVHENGECLPEGKRAWVFVSGLQGTPWREALRVVDQGGRTECVFADYAGIEWRCTVTMETEFEMSAERPEEAK